VAIVAVDTSPIIGTEYIGLYIFDSLVGFRMNLLRDDLKAVTFFSLMAVGFDLVSTYAGLNLGLVERAATGNTILEVLMVVACWDLLIWVLGSLVFTASVYLLSPAANRFCVEAGMIPALALVYSAANNTALIWGVLV
jgi:hypothetical protein